MPRSPTHADTNNNPLAASGLANDGSHRDPAAGVLLLIVALLVVMTLYGAARSVSPAQSPIDAVYRIDVNTAHAGELQLLPNIGPALAQRIIAERESVGPFTGIEDMQRVRGIGPALSARFTDYARFSSDP